MAKDGTNRGGRRVGSGAKRKPLQDKLLEGATSHHTITYVNFNDTDNSDLRGVDMPPPSELLTMPQRDGRDFHAEEVYQKTWNWLNERDCAKLIEQQLLERYAMAVARWIQCEEAVSTYGLLAKHPTTGNAIASPYASLAWKYHDQVNRLWAEIFQIVKENCTTEYKGATPQDDAMELLLRARGNY